MYDSYKHVIEPAEEEPPKTEKEIKKEEKKEEKEKKKEEKKEEKEKDSKGKGKKEDAAPVGYYYPPQYPGVPPGAVPYPSNPAELAELGPPPGPAPVAGGGRRRDKILDTGIEYLRNANLGL